MTTACTTQDADSPDHDACRWAAAAVSRHSKTRSARQAVHLGFRLHATLTQDGDSRGLDFADLGGSPRSLRNAAVSTSTLERSLRSRCETLNMALLMESPTLRMLESPNVELWSQGAEARIYIYTPPPTYTTWSADAQEPANGSSTSGTERAADQLIIKHRFPKKYRHPSLSANLTASRTSLEARALLRAAREGIHVPALRFVDEAQGVIGLQRIQGRTIRRCLGAGDEGDEDEEDNGSENSHHVGLGPLGAEILDRETQGEACMGSHHPRARGRDD